MPKRLALRGLWLSALPAICPGGSRDLMTFSFRDPRVLLSGSELVELDSEMLTERRRPFVVTCQLAFLFLAPVGDDQPHTADGDSAVRRCNRANALLSEWRRGRGLMIPAHLAEVIQLVRIKREAILRLPQFRLAALNDDMLFFCVDDPVGLVVLILPASKIEPKRLAKRIAEADVSQPSLFQVNKQSHMIERRIKAALIASYSRGEHRDSKPQPGKQRTERRVQLVADAAAPLSDDLANHFLFIENDRASEVNVEVLEGDSEQMRLVQFAQRLRGHVTRTGVAYSVQITGNVHRVSKRYLIRFAQPMLSTIAKANAIPT